MLKIYGRKTSFNVQKVMWLTAELGIPHQRIDIGGRFGGLDTPAFLAMNPNGLIPVIEDDGVVVFESNAILRYLARKHGMSSWHPLDDGPTAQADQWMDWALSTLNEGFMGVFVGWYRTKEPNRNWPAIKVSLDKLTKSYQLMERMLTLHPHLSGDKLTMGDIPAAATLYRYYTMDIERPSLPHVEAWYKRMQDRPAYREHVMVAYDEMKETL